MLAKLLNRWRRRQDVRRTNAAEQVVMPLDQATCDLTKTWAAKHVPLTTAAWLPKKK